MAKRGGQRAVHAVAYSFNKSGAYGWFAFVKSTSADKAANIAVDLVVNKLRSLNRLDQVEHQTNLTQDEIADIFDKHFTNHGQFLYSGVTAQQLI
jgi:hypothetical protein